MRTVELSLETEDARQTAEDIEAVLDAIAGRAIDCCSGALERILVDLLEAVQNVAGGEAARPAPTAHRDGAGRPRAG